MPINLIGSLPESLTQGLLVGKLLVSGLGVMTVVRMINNNDSNTVDTNLTSNDNDNENTIHTHSITTPRALLRGGVLRGILIGNVVLNRTYEHFL